MGSGFRVFPPLPTVPYSADALCPQGQERQSIFPTESKRHGFLITDFSLGTLLTYRRGRMSTSHGPSVTLILKGAHIENREPFWTIIHSKPHQTLRCQTCRHEGIAKIRLRPILLEIFLLPCSEGMNKPKDCTPTPSSFTFVVCITYIYAYIHIWALIRNGYRGMQESIRRP